MMIVKKANNMFARSSASERRIDLSATRVIKLRIPGVVMSKQLAPIRTCLSLCGENSTSINPRAIERREDADIFFPAFRRKSGHSTQLVEDNTINQVIEAIKKNK